MDLTNADTPVAGGQLSGDSARQAAIRRIQKLAASPNTGAPGTPKPGGGLVQLPGRISQSATPNKPRRL